VILLFATIFVAELGWAGISPLLPDFQDRFALSDTATGLVLSIAAVGILVVSLPAGALTRRFAVRTLTLWGVAALSIGNVMTGLAGSYGVLLLGRCLLGLGLGMMWVTATAWLHDAAGDRSARALALTTTVVGLGSLVGPAIAGYLGEVFSPGMPFVALGIVCAAMGGTLALAPGEEGRVAEPGPPLREMLRAARADDLMVTSILLTLVVSIMWMTAELLVPLRLDDLGFSASGIGLAFSAASIVFVVASALTARSAERFATIRIAAVWTFAFAAGIVIAAVGVSAPATIVFLVAVGTTSGVLIALTYPLGAVGAGEGGFSVAVVGALLNMVWAGAGIVGPSLGGSLSERLGDQVVFWILAGVGLLVAVWIWSRSVLAGRAAPRPERSAGAAGG
jgi:predicted MFS family arabinose efflux permease